MLEVVCVIKTDFVWSSETIRMKMVQAEKKSADVMKVGLF